MSKPEFVTSEQVYEKYRDILEKLRDDHKKSEEFNKDVEIVSCRRKTLREEYPPIPPSTFTSQKL